MYYNKDGYMLYNGYWRLEKINISWQYHLWHFHMFVGYMHEVGGMSMEDCYHMSSERGVQLKNSNHVLVSYNH